MVKKILIGLIVVVVAFLVAVSLQPADYEIAHSKVVEGPPEVAYTIAGNFKNWKNWSPWQDLDPGMKMTFDGPESGVGSKYAWEGNDEVGAGRMEVTAVQPNKRIDMNLTFLKPFAAESKTAYIFAPVDGGTKVTWTMNGKNDFMGKMFSLVADMEGTIKKDFEKGLTKLGELTAAETERREAQAQADADAADAAADGTAEGEAGADDETAAESEGEPEGEGEVEGAGEPEGAGADSEADVDPEGEDDPDDAP